MRPGAFVLPFPWDGDDAGPNIIAAFNAGFQSLIPELVVWTYAQGEAAHGDG